MCHHTWLLRELYESCEKKELISSEGQEQINFLKRKMSILCPWHLSNKQKEDEI